MVDPYKTTKKIGIVRTKRNYTAGKIRPATSWELHLGLGLKLHEEAAELIRAPHDLAEYADVLQVLQDFATINGVSWDNVLAAAAQKKDKSGSFLPGKLWTANK